VNVKQNMC